MSDYYRKRKPGVHAGKAVLTDAAMTKKPAIAAKAAAKVAHDIDATGMEAVEATQGAKSRKLRMMQKMGLAPLDV
jgi:predicted nicotinamide N-methyase